MFQSADAYKLPPRSLATSLVLHSLGLAILCWAGLPASSLRPHKFHAVLLAPVRKLPVARPRTVPVPRHPEPQVRHALLAPAKLAAPVLAPPPAPVILPDATLPETPLRETALMLPHPEPAILAAAVKLGSFQPAATAPIPLPEAPRIKNAGFQGAQIAAATQPQPALAATGAFDTAAAAKGERRQGAVNHSSGFGDAQAIEASGPARSTVLASNFGDAKVTGPERRAAAAAAAATDPVEILEKPRPAYTEEARRLNIQGEVLLQAAFDASGAVRVLGLLRGLGHGLDEAAMAAARQIRFRPARRNGQPVDSTAVVHIVFQLAE